MVSITTKIARTLIEVNFRATRSREIAKRWLRYANLKSITDYMNIDLTQFL